MQYFIVECALLWVAMCSISVSVLVHAVFDVIDSSKQWKLMADEGIVSRAGIIQELVIVRDGLLCMSTDDFTHNYVLAVIEHLCVD